MKRAVVLLSGGLDSATCLYWAKARGYQVEALTVDYGQRHARELRSARQIARLAHAKLFKLSLPLPWLKVSALVDSRKKLPNLPLSRIGRGSIPSTYVPGRNTIFAAMGVSLADAIGARCVVVGANALDQSGYPDCRPEFYRAFQRVAVLGTRRGSEGYLLRMETPLIGMDKTAIVRLALRLKVPLENTWSCYRGRNKPCGVCDSCKLRAKGFLQAGCRDPLIT